MIVCAGAVSHSQSAPQESAKVSSALEQGDSLALHHEYQAALDAYRRADDLSKHTCGECYLSIATTSLLLGDVPGASEAAARAVVTAGDNRILAADAHLLRGEILVATSSGASDPKFAEAEREYRAAIAASPKKSIARFSLGMLLIGEGRDAEGAAELQAYVDGPFADPKRVDRANRIIANPALARTPTSEDFSFTTLEGERISRDGLRGKVVLLDFWGSWCPPCRESIPMVANLHKKFADRSVEVVGISSDDNEQAWRDFVQTHQMNWAEFLDRDSQVQAIFEIQAFPTFIVLDRNGGIQFRQAGLDDDTEAVIESALNAALAKPYAPSTSSATSTAHPPTANHPVATAEPSSLSIAHSVRYAGWHAADLPLAAALLGGADSNVANASEAGIKLPPDKVDDGDADKGIYRNEFLRFSYKYPAKWMPDPPEEIERQNANTVAWITGQSFANLSGVAVPKILMNARPEARARIPFVRISAQAEGTTTLGSVRQDADRLVRSRGAAIVAPPQEFAIGKQTAFRTEFQFPNSEPALWVASIEMQSGPCRVTIEVAARSREDLAELTKTLQSLTFYGQ
jgi:thiol-disulfide isomerase/thioredoxin